MSKSNLTKEQKKACKAQRKQRKNSRGRGWVIPTEKED